jgi:acetyl-CoA carboxylase carboxyltransferase component
MILLGGKMRKDLIEIIDEKKASLDEARKEKVEKQHSKGRWTARERIARFADEDTFMEYGQLARPQTTGIDGPADGLVMGVGQMAGKPVCIMSYDYMVYAGTQSPMNHRKMDRMLLLARRNRWPVVIWAEGGGARPHEHEYFSPIETFVRIAEKSGVDPTVSIVPGRSFAGHVNIAGTCDVIIATKNACMGMAGPPLVEAATGEKLTAEELGPVELHVETGVIDILCKDESEAIDTARKYLSYFLMPCEPGESPDTEKLREIVPENRRRAYDIRRVIKGIADVDSIIELRPNFGKAAVTALIRIEGRPVGVIANQSMHMGGAINADESDKIARFIRICDAYDLPLLFLCDTPGFMVGSAAESKGLIRHSTRILIALANATVPIMTVVIRKAYGLGYYALGSDGYGPDLLLAWPTAEFGGMGFEGAMNILFKEQLAAQPDEESRIRLRTQLADSAREHFKPLNMARRFFYDNVIDPADTRKLLAQFLKALPEPEPRTHRKHDIDSW